ncbi:MAG: tRNA guanosine(34) transglycosylase Tgt [Ferrimicrobium sp.]|nr:tRNA guanosine(34) transglycosylase Tgt [Ferrimicrobium sp.]
MTHFVVGARDGAARRGRLKLRSCVVETPLFMPVATRGMVRLMPTELVAELGYEVLLSNTYHLMLRPGADVVARMGGLNAFTGFPGASLTDSGGFQIMSLDATITPGGARFRNVYDGSWVTLTPEASVSTQEALRADIAMVLDVCTKLPADRKVLAYNLELTSRWAERCREAHHDEAQRLFGIVQGGVDADLRSLSAQAIASIGFDGYAIGGLAVGESAESTLDALRASVAELPEDRPRYLMGVGDPYLMAHAVALGVDMFDCVAPTRLARHGTALTQQGPLRVKGVGQRGVDEPLDPACGCRVCRRVSRGLLHHLLHVDHESAGALLSIHNLAFQYDLVTRLRKAIDDHRIEEVLQQVDKIWRRPTFESSLGND